MVLSERARAAHRRSIESPVSCAGHARRELRNACAGASLKAAGEQVGFMIDGGFTYAGAHLAAATHTFFMGDLNYRAVPPDLGHARETTLAFTLILVSTHIYI